MDPERQGSDRESGGKSYLGRSADLAGSSRSALSIPANGANGLKNGLNSRRLVLMAVDAVLISLALQIALLLRFEGRVPAEYFWLAWKLAPLAVIIFPAWFYFFRLYHRLWEYASIRELYAITISLAGAMATFAAAVYLLPVGKLPRSTYLIAYMVSMLLIGGVRLSWRMLRDNPLRSRLPFNSSAFSERDGHSGQRDDAENRRILIIGAGDAGALVARELQSHPAEGHGRLTVVGFIDDDPRKQKQYLNGIPVLGDRYAIPEVARECRVNEIIIAMPSVPGRTVREIVKICQTTRAKLKILPGVYELIDGRVSVSRLREVELEDLLGREPVRVNLEEIARYLHGKVVLVTGAGGSIGSELCRQIARFRPQRLLLLDNSENNLFEIDLEIRDRHPGLEVSALLADVKEAAKISYLFDRYRPQIVFHAAAYKHVPMMELNPDEAVKNNVLGTRNAAEAADRCGAEVFILISTDKAVNPSSVMGTTKRLAEMIVLGMNSCSRTRFTAVRFGNVLGSRGSVIPLFKQQIRRGGPVTITHPGMKRYFMTIPEAVQLVIQAGAMAEGGEIFVLDMGEPVSIDEMARDLIRLMGLKPGEDIEIKYIGVRPGEKLHEELFTPEEDRIATRHERIFIARPSGNELDLAENLWFNKLLKGLGTGAPGDYSSKEVVSALREIAAALQTGPASASGVSASSAASRWGKVRL